MKIKRFFAKDIRETLRQVREELGSDAVILSNQSASGGIEIVAAVDYDESLVNGMGGLPRKAAETKREPAPETGRRDDIRRVAPNMPAETAPKPDAKQKIVWAQDPAMLAMGRELESLRALLEQQMSGLAWGEMGRRHPLRAKLMRHLMELDLSPALCQRVANAAPEDVKFEQAWRHSLALLAHKLPVTGDDILSRGGVVALIGPTGVGKTTTVAKLAAHFSMRHGAHSVAMVTTDSYRIGAREQLMIYGRILGVPVHMVNSADELHTVLQELKDKRLVLIDSTGMSQRDCRVTQQIALLKHSHTPLRSYLVLAATSPPGVLSEVAHAYRAVELSGCIFTKLDEANQLGAALSFAIERQLPVAYVSHGQRVPEDLQAARAHSLIVRSVTMHKRYGASVDEITLERSLGGGLAHAQL